MRTFILLAFAVAFGAAPTIASAQGLPASAPSRPMPAIAGVECSNAEQILKSLEYPASAIRQNLMSGQVIVEFTIATNGEISDAHVLSSSNPAFEQASLLAISRFKCRGVGREVKVQAPLAFELR
jgi:protein TonB